MQLTIRTTVATVSALLAASASLVGAVGQAGAISGTETAETRAFAPVDRPGPALSVPQRRLAESVQKTIAAQIATYPHVSEEPPLKSYVFAD